MAVTSKTVKSKKFTSKCEFIYSKFAQLTAEEFDVRICCNVAANMASVSSRNKLSSLINE